MKAKPKAIRELVIQAKAGGLSFEAVAEQFHLPLGTVKTWWSRHRHATAMKPGMKPGAAQGKAAEMKPAMKPETVHRGLMACHMPGRRVSKQATFALFKRGMWPPKAWKVPAHLEGGELLMMLQERASAGLEGRGK